MSNYTKKAVKGSAYVFMFIVFTALFGYLFRTILARYLALADYGLFFSLLSLVGMVGLLRFFGLDAALVKYVAEFAMKKKFDKIKGSINFTLLFSLFTTVFLYIIFYIFSDYLAIAYIGNKTASLYIKIIAVIIPLTSIWKTAKQGFHGFQEMKIYKFIDFSRIAIIFLVVLLLLKFEFSIMAPILAFVLGHAALSLFYPWFFFKHPQVREANSVMDKKLIKKLFMFGIPLIIASIASTIFGQVDTVLLTVFRPLREVGVYNVALPTAKLLWSFGLALSAVLFPLSSELWASKEHEKLREGIEKLYKYSFIIILPLGALMFLFPSLVLKIIFGKQYVAGGIVLRILSIGGIVFNLGKVNMSILSGIGKPRKVGKIMITGALLNLVFNLILIPVLGLIGASLSTLIGFTVIFVYTANRIKKYIRLSFPYLVLFKIVICSILFILSVHILKITLVLELWTEVIMSIGISGIFYVGLLFGLNIINKKELMDIRNRLR